MLIRQLIEQLEAFDNGKDLCSAPFSTSRPMSAPAILLASFSALWAKIKNPEYSQARDRHELFERA